MEINRTFDNFLFKVSRLEGHQGLSGSGASSSASIKSFMLSAKSKNQRLSVDAPQRNVRDPEPNPSPSTSHVSFVDSKGAKNLADSKFHSSTSTEKPSPSTAKKIPDAPSKGSIDMEVLMALPEDMRDQVIAEYRQQGYSVPKSYHKAVDDGNSESPSPQPSTSHASVKNNEENKFKRPVTTNDGEGSNDSKAFSHQQEGTGRAGTVFDSDDSDNEAMITSFSQVSTSFYFYSFLINNELLLGTNVSQLSHFFFLIIIIEVLGSLNTFIFQ